MSVGRRESAVTGFLAFKGDHLGSVLVENKHRHGEAKVLEVLTDTEKVCGEVVVKHEVLNFALDSGRSDAGIISQAVVDFGVETLTGCQSFFLRCATKATKGR